MNELLKQLEAAKQRELELLAVITRMKAACKFAHEDLVIRSKLSDDDSLNISQSALDGLIEAAIIEPPQALREHEAKLKELEWRPIETAPKDGTRILAFSEGEIHVAYWANKNLWAANLRPIYQPSLWMPLYAKPFPAPKQEEK